jgi:hypothetical protein
MVWSEGNTSLKNAVTPPGIDPGTARLVAQPLNHYATPDPQKGTLKYIILKKVAKNPKILFLKRAVSYS